MKSLIFTVYIRGKTIWLWSE